MLTSYNGSAITYDEIGNPLSDGTWNYTWQHGRQLASMSNGTTTWNFSYNSDGLRTQKSNGTTTYNYIYNGSSLSQMSVGNDTLRFFYDANGVPVSVDYNGVTYYYATNIQGDVTAILDATGVAVVEYTYDAWGKPLTMTGTMASTLGTVNPLRYRGYVYDHETGLYYLQSRYYNPIVGRFINADRYASTGQGLLGSNMSSYCLNNPSNRRDNNGECSWFLFIKFDCKKASCSDSKYYNPNAPRVAVLFDGRTSGYIFGLFGGKGFQKQASTLIDNIECYAVVDSHSYTDIKGFIDSWNSLPDNYDQLFIVGHGYAGGLSCAGESISSIDKLGSGSVKYSFESLNPMQTSQINLFVCNGATTPDSGYSVAYYLSEIAGGAPVLAIDGGSINYDMFTHQPYNKGGYWKIVIFPND